MKTLMVIFLFAMVACAMSQYLGHGYNYGYNTYTPGARVSHYASSGLYGAAPYAGYYAGYGAYPYKAY